VDARRSGGGYQPCGGDAGRRVTGTARDRSLDGVSILNPTPPEWMVDGQGRPYFLWDMEMTIERFREQLAGPDPEVRAYLTAKLMRQAKPDDVFEFVTVAQIRADWPRIEPFLGKSRPFWTWLLAAWAEDRDGG